MYKPPLSGLPRPRLSGSALRGDGDCWISLLWCYPNAEEDFLHPLRAAQPVWCSEQPTFSSSPAPISMGLSHKVPSWSLQPSLVGSWLYPRIALLPLWSGCAGALLPLLGPGGCSVIKGALCVSSFFWVIIKVHIPDDSKTAMGFTWGTCWERKKTCNLKTPIWQLFFFLPQLSYSFCVSSHLGGPGPVCVSFEPGRSGTVQG